MRLRKFWYIILLLLFCTTFVLNDEIVAKKDGDGSEMGIVKSISNKLLVFATLEGNLVAIDKISGEIKWKIKDKPIVQVPTDIQDAIIPMLLPDPRDGSLYLVGDSNEPLKKLPFSIPTLVASSPCRSSDGIMYTGKKKDIWFKLDPKTGNKVQVIGWGDVPNPTCPIPTNHFVYIGRTKYNVMMVDSKNPRRKWNVTYYDYTAADMDAIERNNYDYVHFASTSSGRLVTMDRVTGQIIWDGDVGSPVVAAYILDPEGLISVPFTSLANHTITYLARQLLTRTQQMKLYPTLYVGNHGYGLYAIPSLVDSNVVTITATGPDGPLLLGGPYAPEEPQPYAEYIIPGRNYRIPKDIYDDNFQSISDDKMKSYIIVYTGHYNVPEFSDKKFMISGKADGTKLITDATSGETVKTMGPRNKPASKQTQTESVGHDVKKEQWRKKNVFLGVFSYGSVNKTYCDVKQWVNQQENKDLKLVVIILSGCVIAMFWYLRAQVRDIQNMSQNGSKTSQQSYGKNGAITAVAEEFPDGLVKVGKITFHPEQVLGKGCEGTFVYRGEFDSRRVAVKRLLPECFTFADREVALLRESDAHPHVIRYYCMEQDKMFRYIALELCQATLKDYVQGDRSKSMKKLRPLDILYQATTGLAHLHSLDIVHRDIKPHNVLLSVPDNKGEVRAMISDFGLCKKLQVGRMSFSRRSGVTGTDGWIAPEMLLGNERTTCAVDLFSLGCLYYYVLSEGSHPFGDALRRQANILSGEFDLADLKGDDWQKQVQIPLLSALISSVPKNRPECKVVLRHPMFWLSSKILSFLQDVSDRVEKSGPEDPVLLSLEDNGLSVVRGDWRHRIHEEVAKDLRKYRTYRGESVRDLLRALRNKKHHFRELTKEAQNYLGEIPENFTNYWTSRFPLLLVHSWITMQVVFHEKTFSNYYHKDYLYSLANYQDQVDSYIRENPIEILPENKNILEHFEKKNSENYEYSPKYNNKSPRKNVQRISFQDQRPVENVGLYRNLQPNQVNVEDIKISFNDSKPQHRNNNLNFRRNSNAKKKKKSDEPIVWATKDIKE